MKKGAKITIATISVFGVAGLIYWLYTKNMEKVLAALKSNKDKEDGSSSQNNNIPGTRPSMSDNFPLKFGSRDGSTNRVVNLQKFINKMARMNPAFGISQITEDGIWGSQTENAIKKLPSVPNVITEDKYLSYAQYFSASGMHKRVQFPRKKNASGAEGDGVQLVGFGTFKKSDKRNSVGADVQREMRIQSLADRIYNNLQDGNFTNPAIFKELANLSDRDFIAVNDDYNQRNQDAGNLRNLDWEIRGNSTIENQEYLLNRFDDLNLD